MKIVMDACTLILLAKSLVLEKTLNAFEIVTTTEVYAEVAKGKEKKFEDALLAEKLKTSNLLKIDSSNKKIMNQISEKFNMGEGESSVISLALTEKNIIVATDNKQGRKAARVHDLSLIGSLELVVSLNKKGIIDRNKATEAINVLQREGWFQSHLIERALEDVK